jgi:hypothetical protein
MVIGPQIVPACTEVAPELALGVLQNPYLTEKLDLYWSGRRRYATVGCAP